MNFSSNMQWGAQMQQEKGWMLLLLVQTGYNYYGVLPTHFVINGNNSTVDPVINDPAINDLLSPTTFFLARNIFLQLTTCDQRLSV